MKTTLQEIFDITARHLLKQGVRSQAPMNDAIPDGPRECMYRGEDGRKCAAGVHIPDNDYDPRFEGLGLSGAIRTMFSTGGCVDASDNDLSFAAMWTRNGFDEAGMRLLADLQYVHDAHQPHEWRASLVELARRNRLSNLALGVQS